MDSNLLKTEQNQQMMFLLGKNTNLFINVVNTNFYRDASGGQTWYEAISVIEYSGRISPDGESAGHYFCDIKDNKTNVWFRTNDSRLPVPIESCNVSQNGYVVLYKRV